MLETTANQTNKQPNTTKGETKMLDNTLSHEKKSIIPTVVRDAYERKEKAQAEYESAASLTMEGTPEMNKLIEATLEAERLHEQAKFDTIHLLHEKLDARKYLPDLVYVDYRDKLHEETLKELAKAIMDRNPDLAVEIEDGLLRDDMHAGAERELQELLKETGLDELFENGDEYEYLQEIYDRILESDTNNYMMELAENCDQWLKIEKTLFFDYDEYSNCVEWVTYIKATDLLEWARRGSEVIIEVDVMHGWDNDERMKIIFTPSDLDNSYVEVVDATHNTDELFFSFLFGAWPHDIREAEANTEMLKQRAIKAKETKKSRDEKRHAEYVARVEREQAEADAEWNTLTK